MDRAAEKIITRNGLNRDSQDFGIAGIKNLGNLIILKILVQAKKSVTKADFRDISSSGGVLYFLSEEKEKMRIRFYISILSILFGILGSVSEGAAELKIDSVYPTMGIKGQDLPITIKGSGFDADTRVSMTLDVGNRKAILGSVKIPESYAPSVAISDSIAYVANGEEGLQIIDVSNPVSPQIIGSMKIHNYAGRALNRAIDIAISGFLAYVVDQGGIQVINIRDPSNPKIIGIMEMQDYTNPESISISGSLAYVVGYRDGSPPYGNLKVVDVSQPSYPKLIGAIDIASQTRASGIAVSGSLAYVAANGLDGGLYVIDISEPSNPKIIGFVKILRAHGISISGSLAYVVDDIDTSLHVIDIGEPSNPKIIGSVKTQSHSFHPKISVSNFTAYIATEFGLQMIDISNPTNPQIIGSVISQYSIGSVAVSGSLAYIAGSGGLKVVDVSNPTNIQIGSVNTPGYAYGVTISDSLAYVADDSRGLQVIDVKNFSYPVIIGSLELTHERVYSVCVSGSLAYLAHSSGLTIVDISEPSNPKMLGSIDTPRGLGASDVSVVGSIAYVAAGWDGLQIIDVSKPENPKIIGSVNMPLFSYAYGISISGSTVYLAADSGGLLLIDVSKPESSKIIGRLEIPFDAQGVSVPIIGADVKTTDVSVSGSLVYIVSYQIDSYNVVESFSTLWVIDTSSSQNPKIISSMKLSTNNSDLSISVLDSKAYLTLGGEGLQMIDVSIPSNPIIVGTIGIVANDAAIMGKNAIISSRYDGIIIAPLPVEAKPTFINDTTLSATLPSPQLAGNYTIRVFNNNNEASELPGAVTFVPSEKEYLLKTKAIIVNGTTANDKISAETKLASDYAYQTLLFQGYTAESIRYLSFDTSSEGIDAKATYSAVYDAVNNWTKEEPAATELLIYLADHGDDGIFRISENESLRAEDLDMWLDNLQNALNIPVIVIYDACESGTFVSKLQPLAGKKRILMTSASAQPALYYGNGMSFSYQFWNAIYRGEDIHNAFLYAKNQMIAHQTAQIDANGNGIGNETDDEKQADGIKLRRGYRPDIDTPYIYKVSEPQIIQDQSSATLKAYVSFVQDGTPIRKVSAIITPPDFDFASPDTPITDLPEIELQYKGDDLYEGVYTDFAKNGTYNITLCAVNLKGANALYRQTSVTKASAYIGKAAEPKVLYGGNNTSATIWGSLNAQYRGIAMSRVWARITPPVLSLPPFEIDLSDPEKDGIYQADYSNFTNDGTYTVSIFGMDDKGYISPAISTTVTRIGTSPNADAYEDDNTLDKARSIVFNESRRHNFHDADDSDWIKFFAQAGKLYTIRASNPSPVCDTTIELYRRNGVLLQSVNNKTAGQEESYDWKCPETGIYAVRIKNADPQFFGKDVAYDFQVYQPVAAITGIIQGTIKDKTGNPISEARISGGGYSGLSSDNGFYSIRASVGAQTLRVEADGYMPFETSVTVAENQIRNQIVILYPMAQIRKGDINLSDVIAALRTVSGIADQAVHSEADVNGDGKIGVEEVIYILQRLAVLRLQ